MRGGNPGQAATRAREIGMRKVLGAARPQLVKQFWGEALLMSSIALVLGVLLAALLLPTFNRLAEKDLVLDVFSNASTVLALAGLVLLVGLVVGSYPALALSGLHPVELIRNRLRLSGRSTLTRSLVVFQFACSVILIVSTLIMSRQLDYMQSKDLGLNQEHVVGFPANAELLEIFRNEWATHPAIVNLTGTSYTTNRTGTRGSEDLTLDGSDTLDVVHYRVDYGYLETLDLDLVAGRSFSRDRGTDATEGDRNVVLKKLKEESIPHEVRNGEIYVDKAKADRVALELSGALSDDTIYKFLFDSELTRSRPVTPRAARASGSGARSPRAMSAARRKVSLAFAPCPALHHVSPSIRSSSQRWSSSRGSVCSSSWRARS